MSKTSRASRRRPFRSAILPKATSWKRNRTTRSRTATAAELPLALNGRIEKAGDVDFFKFTAKKGQVWEIECYARRIGSPVDPVVNIYKADKAMLAGQR